MLDKKKSPSNKDKELSVKTEANVLEFPNGLQMEKKKLREEALSRWEQITVKIRKDLRAKRGASFVKNIGRLLNEEDLGKLRQELDPEEISALNATLENMKSKVLDSNEIRHMSLELKKAYIEISSELKGPVKVALEAMTLKDHLGFIEERPELASLHLQNLSSVQLGSIINEMGAQDAADFIAKGAQVPSDNLDAYEKAVLEYKKVEVSPFARSLSSALKRVGPTKERAIFDSLLAKKDSGTAKTLAKESFPSFLLLNLPPAKLKEPLKELQAQDLAAFILCQEGDHRDKWTDIIAEEGSKLKEMLMMEMEGIEGSEPEMARVQARKEETLKKVYGLIRAQLSGDENQAITESIISEWAQSAA